MMKGSRQHLAGIEQRPTRTTRTGPSGCSRRHEDTTRTALVDDTGGSYLHQCGN